MYRAYKNGSLIFDTTVPTLCFSSARLNLIAGSAGSFVFTVPPDHPAYGTFDKLVDYIEVYHDDDLIFIGRVYSIDKNFNTQQTITCEGMLAVFNDSVFRPVTFSGNLHDLVRDLVNNHNDQVEYGKQIQLGTIYVPNFQVYREYAAYETTISRLQDLVSSFGGFLSIRKHNGSLFLDWHLTYDQGNTQSIDFKSNLLDIKTTDDASRIVTVLIPLGEMDEDGNRLTIKSVNDGLDYLEAPAAQIQKYGYVVGTKIWDDVTSVPYLKIAGQNWLDACLAPVVQINVTAVDLADAGYDVWQFIVGQKLRVRSAPHLINGWFNCTEQNLDLLHPEQNRLVLGTEQINYTSSQRSLSYEIQHSIAKISKNYTPKTALQTAIDTATSLITGNSGGYVVLHDSNDDGQPDELLVMDTPDINTAVKVWRFNNAGLGYSSTGYDGTYGLAMTINGQIVADYISAGTLNADLLRAGVIRGQTGNTYWNLVTGEFHMEGEFDVDKSKVFVSEPTTPYFVGDLWVTNYSRNSGIAGYAVAGDAVVGDDSAQTGTGSIMMCIFTRTSGAFQQADWELVTDYIDSTALSQLQDRMTQAELNISAQEAEIELKASVSAVNDLAERVSQAEIDVAGYDGRITLLATNVETVSAEVARKSKTFYQEPVPPYDVGDTWITSIHEPYNAIVGNAITGDAIIDWGKDIYVCTTAKEADESYSFSDWALATDYVDQAQFSGMYQRMSTAEINIDAANARIDLKADESTVTALYSQMNVVELTLDAHEGQIQSKVSQTDWNGETITSLINQSASTVQINAAHINLSGGNISMTAGALTLTTDGTQRSAFELVYGQAKLTLAPGMIQLYSNNTKRFQLLAGTLMGYDSSGNVSFGISTQTGSITLKNPLFKIVTKDFWARLSGTAAAQYWDEGEVNVSPDAGYEVVGLGGFSAIAYVADGSHSTLGNSSMINVYRAAIVDAGNNVFTLQYGFSNSGVTTWDVHFFYYLLEAYTKGTVS